MWKIFKETLLTNIVLAIIGSLWLFLPSILSPDQCHSINDLNPIAVVLLGIVLITIGIYIVTFVFLLVVDPILVILTKKILETSAGYKLFSWIVNFKKRLNEKYINWLLIVVGILVIFSLAYGAYLDYYCIEI